MRFFQRQGLDAPAAISSGAIAGTASWVVKGALFLVCLPFAVGDFHKPTSSDGGSHEDIVWIILIVVLAIAVLVAVVTLVPRVRRLAAGKARPHLVTIWKDVKAIAVEPRKIAYVLGGSLGSQVLIALCLGASLHSVGEHASFATLIVVLTLAAMIGGAVPVPGGAGVIEVGLIAGLTAPASRRTRPWRPSSSNASARRTCRRSGAGPRWSGCVAATTSDRESALRVSPEGRGGGQLVQPSVAGLVWPSPCRRRWR